MYQQKSGGPGVEKSLLIQPTRKAYLFCVHHAGRTMITTLIIAAALLLTCLCATAAPQSSCPISGKSVDKTHYVDYQGKRIYFGDALSREVFISNPQPYFALLSKHGISLDDAPPLSGGESEAALQGRLYMQFNEESQISRRYEEFAARAQEDGYPQVAKLYRASAEAEKIHAKLLANILGLVNSTEKNLKYSTDFELFVNKAILPDSRALAEKDSDPAATVVFTKFQGACAVHARLFGEALKSVQTGKDIASLPIHVCPDCGNIIIGDAPDKCPICRADRSRFIAVK